MSTYIITGASGLLGRSVYNQFKKQYPNDKVIGLAHSRVKGDLVKLDLTNTLAVKEFFELYQPKVVVHCAAERRPDVAENDSAGTIKLNKQVTQDLSQLCEQHKSRLIYISTDYVFDGRNPPYKVDAKPNPLNFYGETKLMGEQEVIKHHQNGVIVRVPVLYGEVEYEEESAVNVLVKLVKNPTNQTTMDHHAARFPTYIGDIAQFLASIAAFEVNHKLPSIAHFSAPQRLTKYEMCQILGEVLNVPIDHIISDTKIPDFIEGAASRPEDAELVVDQLDMFNLHHFQFKKFQSFFTEYLKDQ